MRMIDPDSKGCELRPRRPGVWRWLGWIVLGASVWLSLVKFPSSPAAALDPSWQMTLAYAAANHLQFGTEVVFTYGPLGYLLSATNTGILYGHYLLWQVLSNVVFAVLIVAAARPLRFGNSIAYYACILILFSPFLDLIHMAVILGLGVTLLHDGTRRQTWIGVGTGALFAVLALIKFTNLLFICFSIGCVAAHHAWKRRWLDFTTVIAVFPASFVVGWMMLGQRVSNVPAFLLNSGEISGGYSEAMALYEQPGMLLLGLGAGLGVVFGYGLNLRRAPDFPRSLGISLIAAGGVFMNWKHGFTRSDSHVLIHFIFCLFLVVVSPAIFPFEGRPARRAKSLLLALSAACSLWGIQIASPGTLWNGPDLWSRMKESARAIGSVGDLARASHQQYTGIRNAHGMPLLKALAGDGTLDVLGHDQAYAIFNEFNYRPRPVFQSYSAYTAALLHLNEAYYTSSSAPEFVMQKMQVIDDRMPALEDSLVTRQLYNHYAFVAQERGFLIWRRQTLATQEVKGVLAGGGSLVWGQPITLPSSDAAPLWVELDIPSSWLGRIRNFLYKTPLVSLIVTDGDGFQKRYRLVTDMARAGFLAKPYFTSNDQIAQFEAGAAAHSIVKLAVEVAPSERKYFREPMSVHFIKLTPFPRSAPVSAGKIVKFPRFNHQPSAVNALFPVSVVPENGRDVVVAHPPSDITFDINSPARRVTGGYGLLAAAYAPPNRTDGAEFILEWTGRDGRTTILLHRNLRPSAVESDRGRQSFDLALPGEKGRLVLRTTPGPVNDLAFDWTYWADLDVTDN